MKCIFLFVLTLFIGTRLLSQPNLIVTDNFYTNTIEDTVLTIDTPNNIDNFLITNNLDTTKSVLLLSHSPKKATLLSTFIPGAGQIYNKQAWKVPIIYLAAAGVTYFAITNGKNKNKFKDEYYNRINGRTDLLLNDYISYTDDGIYNLYNAYKSNFQLSIIVGVVFYALQIMDAYVYAHLFNFNLTEDLSMNISPFYLPSTNQFTTNHCLGFSFNFQF